MAINLLNNISSTGSLTITKPTTDPLLTIHNTTNGGGAAIRFLDTSGGSQPGDLTYRHSDSQSQGGGASWHFVSEPDTVLVVGSSSVNGRFVAKSAGSSSEVDYGFYDDVDTGMYRAGANSLRLVAGGISGVSVSATGVELRYAGSTKLQTTSGGVTVTGGMSVGAINTTGTLDISSSYPRINLNDTNSEDDWSIINDDGSFTIYNVDDNVHALKINGSNDITISSDVTVLGTNGVTAPKFKLNNNWQLQPAGSSYAKFTNWVNIESTGFYTTSDLYMDLDDSSSRFVVRGTGNTEIFVINTAASNAASFTGDVTLTDGVLTVNDGNNYVKISEGTNSIGQIELKDGNPVFVQGWGNEFKVGVGTYDNTALTINSSKNATFAGNGEFNTSLKINAPDTGGAPAMTAVMNMHGYDQRGVGIKMKDNVNTSAGSTDAEWFVGTGYNSTGFNIGYASDGSQSSYPAQAKLSITTSGNATFAGSITTTSASGIKIDTTGNALLELDGASGSTEAIIFKHSGTEVSRISHSNSTDLVFSTGSSVATALTLSGLNATFAGDITLGNDLNFTTNGFADISNTGTGAMRFKPSSQTLALTLTGANAAIAGKGTSSATITSDGSSTLTTKGYVDSLITGATIYRGTWDPDVSLNSGYGNPNLNTVTQTSGYYYICSADGTATPNGTGNEPDSWNTGDWVIWNDDIGTGEWQKIDNSSVLSGAGTGQTVALWQGLNTVTDSETLGNAPITVNGNDVKITSAGDTNLILQSANPGSTSLDFYEGTGEKAHVTFDTVNNVLTMGRAAGGLSIDNSGNSTFAGNIIAGGAVYPATNASASLGLSNKQWAGLDLSSSSAITWGNGDAEIIEGETNNYSLTFKTYDGTSNSAALRLDGDNTATFAGDVTLTNGQLTVTHDTNNVAKIIQTDTSMSNATYTFEVDSSSHNSNMSTAGAMAVDVYSGRAFTIDGKGDIGIGTNAPATLLHVKGDADDNESVLFIENTYSSGGVFFPAALFKHTASNHSYGTVAEFRTEGTSSDRPSILFSNGHTSNNWSIGQGVTGANDNFAIGYRNFHPNTSGGWATSYLTINTSGNATFAGDVQAPGIYVGATNTSFDFYNNGTSYLNGAVTVDAAFTQSGGAASSFSGNVTATNILTVAGAATGSPFLQFTQGGSQKAYIQYVDSGDSFELQSDNQFGVRTGGSTVALTINSSQNATFTGQIDAQTIEFDGIVNSSAIGALIGRNHAYDTLELRGHGAELMIGSKNQDLHINYRTCNNGAANNTPINWFWRAGSSTSFSNHSFGTVTATGLKVNTFSNNAGNLIFSAGNTTTGASRTLNLRNSGSTGDPSSSDDSNSTGITWGSRTDSNPYYIIYPNLENWSSSGNYSKLTLAWHTGIKIGADKQYGGTRFYNNSPDISGAAVILNVGVGNDNIGVVNNLTVGGQATGPAPTTTTSYANKAYVDAAVAGVPQGDVTGITVSNGITGSSLTGPVPAISMSGTYAGNFNFSTNNVVVGGNFSNNAYNSTTGARLMFGGGNSDAIGNYYIGTNLENFGGNYNKLDLRWHTGIRIGAQSQYGGVRIYDSEDLGTVLFSVGTSSTNVAVTNGLTVGGKITASGGIDGLTLANGGINGANYDIRGVNQLVISDPGEGIVFTGTTTMYLNAVDDATDSILKLTNATQLNLNSTARITNLVDPSSAQDAATKNYVDTEIGNIPSGLAFEGNWNASTDTPTLSGTTQDNGKFWIVSVAGSTNLSGITDWAVGDWAIYVDNGAGTDAWQKVDNSSSLAGAGSAGKVTFWSSTSNVSFNNNFTYDGTYLTAPRMRVGDGTDGYFYSDTAGRTAFRDGDFYIQSNVGNYYNYATNMYLGNTTGDNVLFRGSTITGTSWGITPAGAATFTTVTGTTVVGGVSTSNVDGQGNIPFKLSIDYSSYMVAAAGSTWGLFWAGNSGARYGTNGNGGPGNIWGNSGNPNEFVFVGGDNTRWTVNGNTGDTWQNGDLYVGGGDIILSGTGRIQGVDTVSAGTDAANKTYVDTKLSLTGGTMTGAISMGTQIFATASNYGRGVFGLYSPTKYQHVWSMGNAYKLADAGTSTGTGGNLYGLAWSYNPNYGAAGNNAQAKAGLNHQLLLMQNGTTTFAAGSGMWTSGTITANNGQIVLNGTGRIQGVDTVSASTDAANKAYVDAHDGGAGVYLPLAGGTMTGAITMNDNVPINFGTGGSSDSRIFYDALDLNIESQGGKIFIVKDVTDLSTGIVLDSSSNVAIGAAGGASASGAKLTVTGNTYVSGTIQVPDNGKLAVGNSLDLQIYHDAANSYIETSTSSTGDLYIKANGTNHDLYLQAVDDIFIRPQGGENGITVVGNGAVSLYHNNVSQLETTSTGIQTNTIDATVAAGSAGNFVVMDGTRLAYRTAAQVLSDIGGTSSSGVTSVATTAPILGGTITSTGTISLRSPVSGNWHNGGAPVVGTDGLMEIGRYIDFHTSNTGTSDYDVRLNATSGLLTVTGSVSSSSNITSTGYMQSSYIRCTSSGTRFAPTFSFTSDTNTGMFRNGTDQVALSAGGNTRVLCTSTYVKLDGNVGIGRVPSTKLDIDGTVLVKDGTGLGDLYLGNLGTNNHFRFHTNNSNTYFDMNCGNMYWRQGSSTRYTFFPSTANMTINGTLTQNSDVRRKENIVEIKDCISKVKAMRGVYYNRTDINTEVTKVGVIAQEVEAVLPEVILESPEDGLKSVAYSELTSVLINAIKEQQEIIEDLKTRITKLEN